MIIGTVAGVGAIIYGVPSQSMRRAAEPMITRAGFEAPCIFQSPVVLRMMYAHLSRGSSIGQFEGQLDEVGGNLLVRRRIPQPRQ